MPQLQTDSDDVFLLYHAASHKTGERLGQYLGVPHGRNAPSGDWEHLIRWGSRAAKPANARVENVLNARSAIRNASQKYDALQRLDEAGVPVPNFTRNRDDIGPDQDDELTYPVLGRQDSHTQGTDINLIMQFRDAYLTDNDHFVDYIPTKLEYRMHVIDGEVVKVHEKRLRREADNHPYIRNHETGWVFVNPREEEPDHDIAIDAVEEMGLDVGAVDVIRAEETGNEYVLEVNTAPSLDENNLERYGQALKEQVGLSSVAGMNNVDWSDDNEEE